MQRRGLPVGKAPARNISQRNSFTSTVTDIDTQRNSTYCRSGVVGGIGHNMRVCEERSSDCHGEGEKSVQTDDLVFGEWVEGLRKRHNIATCSDASYSKMASVASKTSSYLVSELSTQQQSGQLVQTTREADEQRPLLSTGSCAGHYDDSLSADGDDDEDEADRQRAWEDTEDVADVLSSACSATDLIHASFNSLVDICCGEDAAMHSLRRQPPELVKHCYNSSPDRKQRLLYPTTTDNDEHGSSDQETSKQLVVNRQLTNNKNTSRQHNLDEQNSNGHTGGQQQQMLSKADQLTQYNQSVRERDVHLEISASPTPSNKISGLQHYLSKRGIDIDVSSVQTSDV